MRSRSLFPVLWLAAALLLRAGPSAHAQPAEASGWPDAVHADEIAALRTEVGQDAGPPEAWLAWCTALSARSDRGRFLAVLCDERWPARRLDDWAAYQQSIQAVRAFAESAPADLLGPSHGPLRTHLAERVAQLEQQNRRALRLTLANLRAADQASQLEVSARVELEGAAALPEGVLTCRLVASLAEKSGGGRPIQAPLEVDAASLPRDYTIAVPLEQLRPGVEYAVTFSAAAEVAAAEQWWPLSVSAPAALARDFSRAAPPPPPPPPPGVTPEQLAEAVRIADESKRIPRLQELRDQAVKQQSDAARAWIDWYLGAAAEAPAGFRVGTIETSLLAPVDRSLPANLAPPALLTEIQRRKAARFGIQNAQVQLNPQNIPDNNWVLSNEGGVSGRYDIIIELFQSQDGLAGVLMTAGPDRRRYDLATFRGLPDLLRQLPGSPPASSIVMLDEGVGEDVLKALRGPLGRFSIAPALAALNNSKPWNDARRQRLFYYLCDPRTYKSATFTANAAVVQYSEGYSASYQR